MLVAAALFLPDPSVGQPHYRTQGAYPYRYSTSLKQTLIDVLLRKILQTSKLANVEQKDEWMMDNSNAVEKASDQLTAVTRYVGVAYHLLKGSPDGDFDVGGIDPGIRVTRVIFDFTYTKNVDGQELAVPDQVNFHPLSGCSGNGQGNFYSGAKSYQKSLDLGLNAGGT